MIKRFRNSIVAKLFLLSLLLPALLLEITLQLVSFGAWFLARDAVDAAHPGGQRVVLCVGDSHTYGSGSSTRDLAYPAQLERLLNGRSANSASWRVSNRGWPGRNSSELVQRLAGMMAEDRPEFVCFLVGTNNRWSTADMQRALPSVEPSDDERLTGNEWIWRLRITRLWQVLGGALTKRPEDPAVALPGAPKDPAESKRIVKAYRKDFRNAHTSQLRPSAEEDPTGLIRDLLEARRIHETGDHSRAMDLVERRRAEASQTPVKWAVQLFVEFLFLQSRHQEAVDAGLQAIARLGPDPVIAAAMIRPLARMGRMEEAQKCFEESLAHAPEDPWVHRGAAVMHKLAMDYQKAIERSVCGFLYSGNAELLEADLRGILQPKLGKERLESLFKDALETLPLQPPENDLLQRMFVTILNTHEAKERLQSDLMYMVRMVRARRATPILVGYPQPWLGEEVQGAIREAATLQKAAYVEVASKFKEALKGAQLEDLFIPDKHPNDRGYGIIAGLVAERIVPSEPAGDPSR